MEKYTGKIIHQKCPNLTEEQEQEDEGAEELRLNFNLHNG